LLGGDIQGCSNCRTEALVVVGPSNDAIGVWIDNNRIEAGDSPASSLGINLRTFQNPAVAEISNNWIKGGNGQWTRGINGFGAAAGTVIAGNEVFAGTQTGNGNGTSFAMLISGETVVDGNWINHDPNEVGSCPSPAPWYWCGGIESEGATAIYTNNVIYGMPAPKSAGILITEGEVPFGDVELNGNTIDGGGVGGATTISSAVACRTTQGTNAMIGDVRNNILTGGTGMFTFGFFEDDQTNGRTCVPTSYENNAIYDAINAHRQWTGGGFAILFPTVPAVNMTFAYASNNVDTDCDVDNTWHLMPGSMCVDMGTMTEAPATDIDGETRPIGAGIDIGADESE
jgi:hypothetical protein